MHLTPVQSAAVDAAAASRCFRVGITRDLRGSSGAPLSDFNFQLLDEAEIDWDFLPYDEVELSPESLDGCDAVLIWSPRLPRRTIRDAHRLKLAARIGVGFDNVDIQACTEYGVIVTNTPLATTTPMATSAITYLLALAHQLLAKDRIARSGRWDEKWGCVGLGLRGRTLGLIGLGNVGRETARLAGPFGLHLVAYDPYVDDTEAKAFGVQLMTLEELLRSSDFVCVACPLTPETTHLINRERLALMKSSAYLINIARGRVVEQDALVAALQEGQIKGAAVDVFEHEPEDPRHPIFSLDQVITSPHAIGHTDECFLDSGSVACSNAIAVAAGRLPEHVLNPIVLTSPDCRSNVRASSGEGLDDRFPVKRLQRLQGLGAEVDP